MQIYVEKYNTKACFSAILTHTEVGHSKSEGMIGPKWAPVVPSRSSKVTSISDTM